MGKISIDTVKQYTEFLVRKNNSKTISPTQFNLIINRAQLSVFMDRYGNPHEYRPGSPVPAKAYAITQKILDDLRVFQESANLILSLQGRASYPTDYVHLISLKYLTQKNGSPLHVPIEVVDQDKEGYRLGSEIVGPTKQYPFAVLKNTYFQIYPALVNVELNYLRYPREAFWGSTVVNGRFVFDPATSINLEWEDVVINDIVSQALKSIGISIKDGDILNFAQQQSAEGS